MNFLFAPDSFKGSLTALEITRILERVTLRHFPDAHTRGVPVADGGEGTVEALVTATRGQYRQCQVTGPLGDTVTATWGLLGGAKTAVLEMAQASGLPLTPPDRRDPRRTTTLGTGEMMRLAAQAGAEAMLLGIGGSATNDGGMGMLTALGARFEDAQGHALPPVGGNLGRVERVILDGLDLDAEYLRDMDKLYVIACGSSYHVGMVAKHILEKLLRKPVEVTLASEFRYCDPLVTDRTLCLVISQSGETIDTLAALREAKRLGARVLSIVNVVGSTIARESDDVLYTWAGPEIAVATTKAFSTQLAVVYLIGLYCAEALGTLDEAEYDRIVSELLLIPTKLEQILDNRADIQYFASLYFNHPSIFFIGRNIDYAIGMEGSLKLKEISYIHSEAYAAGELKHGTISLIEPGTLVVALASYVKLFDKTMSNVVEVKSRGADVLGLTVDARAADMAKTVDHVIPVPDTHPLLLPSLDVVPMQLFAYYVALQRGCDIDKPRNLAKSVTVE